jgi:glutaminase
MMKRFLVTDNNREFLLSEYVDNIVMNMGVRELQSLAATLVYNDKENLTNEQIQAEIQIYYPHILEEA